MIKNNFYYKNSITTRHLNRNYKKTFSSDFGKIKKKLLENLDNYHDTFHILSKKFKLNFDLKQLQKFKRYNTVVIIGMGGSILGIETIYYFLQHKIKKKFYFLDDIDEKKIKKLNNKLNINKTLFIIISKSGNTIETISNFLFLKLTKKNPKNVIIISEKKNNFLFLLSKRLNIFFVEHKDYIGGRYSVLSEVGLMPAYLMGVNLLKIRSCIRTFLIDKGNFFLRESAIKLAALIKNKKYKNIILLNYSPQLEKFLFWYQQLIAESLGKKGMGFLPVISNAPKDHHSLLQLYLDGPKDKLFYIFSFDEKSKNKINAKKFANQFNYLSGKSLSKIKYSQKMAIVKTFSSHKIPFREFILKKIDEETLGELFSYFILETAIVGKLVKINPFDQPAVEQVKLTTKKILT